MVFLPSLVEFFRGRLFTEISQRLLAAPACCSRLRVRIKPAIRQTARGENEYHVLFPGFVVFLSISGVTGSGAC
jgi:hypothetical protein